MLKNKSILWVVGLIVVALGLLIVPSFLGNGDSTDANNVSGVPCIYSEVFHIHPHLQILVDGQEEVIPASIGIEPGCTREIHTHDITGEIHIEAAKDRGFKFADFLSVSKFSLEKPSYTLKMTVNGTETIDANFVMKDKQHILLDYTKIQSSQ